MAMKTKKERFHVGALNRDLKGEMSRERRRSRRRREASPNSSILQAQDKGWGKGGVACALKRISKVNPVTQACGAYRFGIQLVSVLGQNLFHTGLFCVRDKAKTPDRKRKTESQELEGDWLCNG